MMKDVHIDESIKQERDVYTAGTRSKWCRLLLEYSHACVRACVCVCLGPSLAIRVPDDLVQIAILRSMSGTPRFLVGFAQFKKMFR